MRLWSETILRACRRLLPAYTSLEEALPDVTKACGFPVTVEALERAFRRHGYGAVGQYLAGTEKVKKRRGDMTPLEMAEHDLDLKKANKEKRNVGRTEYIAARLAEAAAALPPMNLVVQPLRSPKWGAKQLEPEAVWADLSDIQIGSKVDAAQNGGLNEHTFEIFLDKLNRWENQYLALVEERLCSRPVSNLTIALCGDIVDGQSIFATQPFEIDRDVYEQLIEGSRALSAAFVRIRKTFPSIPLQMLSVAGNHGRVGRYGESPHRVNWDTVLAQFVKLQMEAAGASPTDFHIPDTWYALVELFGQTHMITHGDTLNSQSGVPIAAMKAYLLKHSQLFGRPIAWAHMGHWHAEATVATTAGGLLVNGNFVGSNAFSARAMVEGSQPVQLVYGFTRSCGLTWTQKLYLRTREEMKPKLDIRSS